MAVKSQANIDSGAALALAGSRQQGVELATSAGGKNIAGTDICEEFGHGGSGTGSNINLGSYHTGSGGLVPSGTANVAASAGATKRFQNYVGTANTSIDSSWTMNSFNANRNIFTGNNIFSEAFAYVYFSRVNSGTYANTIRVTYGSGTSANYATQYNEFINYTNLGSATWTARYNVVSMATSGDASNPSCHGSYTAGPTPVSDGYNSGTFYTIPAAGFLQFWWLARANPNTPCSHLANVLGNFDYQNRVGGSGLAPFEVKASLGGTDYVSKVNFSDPLIRTVIQLVASTNATPSFL